MQKSIIPGKGKIKLSDNKRYRYKLAQDLQYNFAKVNEKVKTQFQTS